MKEENNMMITRPVFIAETNLSNNKYQVFSKQLITFNYNYSKEFSIQQENAKSLKNAFLQKNPDMKLLEVSSRSDNVIGKKLSAFDLKMEIDDIEYILESLFQGSKCFKNGGPYQDLYHKTPSDAKSDMRLKSSGELIGFQLFNTFFPAIPKTLFYDFLYCNALLQNRHLIDELVKYNAFSDIAFNPKYSINCQAEACAIFTSLYLKKIPNEVFSNADLFNRYVFKKVSIQHKSESEKYEQLRLFE